MLCYEFKTLKNGEHPLMICVCKDGKRKYISLGIFVNLNFGAFKKGNPKRNCPNRERINLLIKEQEQKYSEQVMEFSIKSKDYTLSTEVYIERGI